jgi:hypothetical protein
MSKVKLLFIIECHYLFICLHLWSHRLQQKKVYASVAVLAAPAPSVASVANDKGDNEMIPGTDLLAFALQLFVNVCTIVGTSSLFTGKS